MLMLLFAYHQVMSPFVEFVLAFGKQHSVQDFHFSGFRAENNLSGHQRIDALGRSGRILQMCYSLKGVEHQKLRDRLQWTIRGSAVYHSFDIESGRTVWVMIKGNFLLRDRIESAKTKSTSVDKNESLALASALETHLLLCDWAADNWRWYINFLEERVQDITQGFLSVMVDGLQDEIAYPSLISIHNTRQDKTDGKRLRLKDGARRLFRMPTQLLQQVKDDPTPTGRTPQPKTTVNGGIVETPIAFSFDDLQRLQAIEDKANEASLTVSTNIDILRQIRANCRFLVGLKEEQGILPELTNCACTRQMELFERQVELLECDLKGHTSRIAALLRIIADRKALVCQDIAQRQALTEPDGSITERSITRAPWPTDKPQPNLRSLQRKWKT